MGRNKKLGLVALLGILVLVPLVISSSLVNVSPLSLLKGFVSTGSVITTSAPVTPNVFVNPASVIQDYTVLPIGSKFTVYVNVSSVTDLYTWQLNLTWNYAVLNISRISEGAFLLQTTSVNKTSSYQLGYVMNKTDNTKGYGGMSDSILGSVSGISGSGCLVAVQFLVVGYGTSSLSISLLGNLKTTMLNSTGGTISFTKVDGYFKNKLGGDSNGDGQVNIADIGTLSAHWTGAPGTLPYSRDVDNNDDGVINIADVGVVSANWGRHYP